MPESVADCIELFLTYDSQATDLIPIEHENTPDNLRFLLEDATAGIGFPDAYFDLVHARMILAGVSCFSLCPRGLLT